jgi:hypothetical protein
MAERDWREGRSPAQNRRLARIPEDKREELSRGIAGLYRTGAEFTPGVSDALTAQEVYDAAKQGDYSTAALLATLAAIGLVPGAGDAASAAGKALLKDAAGEPLMLFRGLRGSSEKGIPQAALDMQPRDYYSVFASDNPYLAATYGNPDFDFDIVGAIAPFHVQADELVEFPVRVWDDGSRHFDMFEFDRRAKSLKPNQVLVARQIRDIGPAASLKVDPEMLYSYDSDVYALGRGVKTTPAVGTKYLPKFKTREGKPFASGGSVTMPSEYSKGRWRLI